MTLMYLLVLGIGMLMPVQASINSRLAVSLKSPYRSALIVFGVASLSLILLLVLTGQTPWPSPAQISQLPPWMWMAGIFTVSGTTLNIIVFPRIGSLNSVILPLLGQISMSLMIEHFGLFANDIAAVTFRDLLLLALFIVGVYIVLAKDRTSSVKKSPVGIYHLLAVVSGALMAIQVTITASLTQAINNSWLAALVSFLVGFVLLYILNSYRDRTLNPLGMLKIAKLPLPLYSGGLLQVGFLLGNALAVAQIGPAMMTLYSLMGRLVTGVIIDHYGWMHLDRRPIRFHQIIGLMIILGVVLLLG